MCSSSCLFFPGQILLPAFGTSWLIDDRGDPEVLPVEAVTSSSRVKDDTIFAEGLVFVNAAMKAKTKEDFINKL